MRYLSLPAIVLFYYVQFLKSYTNDTQFMKSRIVMFVYCFGSTITVSNKKLSEISSSIRNKKFLEPKYMNFWGLFLVKIEKLLELGPSLGFL